METTKQPGECPCGLNLGVEQLSTQEAKDFQYLINQPIDFQGPCDTYERTLIRAKIEELKDKIKEYYFEKDNKLIAIPNQITNPKHPHVIDPEETNSEKRNRNNIFIDKNCEDKLHQSIIKAVREMKQRAFVFQGFQSKDCIKAKLEKGKNFRKEKECRCKHNRACHCEKERFPDLNTHENDVMELLDIKKLDDEEIDNCSQLLKDLKIRENNREVKEGEPTKAKKQKVEAFEGESWLFSKVNTLSLTMSRFSLFFDNM